MKRDSHNVSDFNISFLVQFENFYNIFCRVGSDGRYKSIVPLSWPSGLMSEWFTGSSLSFILYRLLSPPVKHNEIDGSVVLLH